jgi:hypothetical protein
VGRARRTLDTALALAVAQGAGTVAALRDSPKVGLCEIRAQRSKLRVMGLGFGVWGWK